MRLHFRLANAVSHYRTIVFLKLHRRWFDSKSMNNELIAAIESARANGNIVKSIRKQKYAPGSFYMSTTLGKQLGPVNCQGDQEALDRKFNEAQAHLDTIKPAQRIAA